MVKLGQILSTTWSLTCLAPLVCAGPVVVSKRATVTKVFTTTLEVTDIPTVVKGEPVTVTEVVTATHTNAAEAVAEEGDEPMVTVTEVLTTTAKHSTSPMSTTAGMDTDVVTVTKVSTTTTHPPPPPPAPSTATTTSEEATSTVTAHATQTVLVDPLPAPIAECWTNFEFPRQYFIKVQNIPDEDVSPLCGGIWDNLHAYPACPVIMGPHFCGLRRQSLDPNSGAAGLEPDGWGGGVPAYGTGLFMMFNTWQGCLPEKIEMAFDAATYGGKYGKVKCGEKRSGLWQTGGDYQFNTSTMANIGGPVNDTELQLDASELRNVTDISSVPESSNVSAMSKVANVPAIVRSASTTTQSDNPLLVAPPHEFMSSAAGPEWNYNTSCVKDLHKEHIAFYFSRSYWNIKAPKVPLDRVEPICQNLMGNLTGWCRPTDVENIDRIFDRIHWCKPMHPERGGIWWQWLSPTVWCERDKINRIWIEATGGEWGPLFCYMDCDPIITGMYPDYCLPVAKDQFPQWFDGLP